MSKDYQIPRDELSDFRKQNAVTGKSIGNSQGDLCSVLEDLNNPKNISSVAIVNTRNHEQQLLNLQNQLNHLKKEYPVISLFMLDEQKKFIEDIINGRKDSIQQRLNLYMDKSTGFGYDEKQFLAEWYKDLSETDEEIVSGTTLKQITYLLTDIEMLDKFTRKGGVFGKTLFRKAGLSPFVLQNDKVVEEYRGFRNITVGMQYFLSWLLDDKDMFGSLEMQFPYEIPLKDDNKIISMKMVNTKFGKYDSYLPKSDLSFGGEMLSSQSLSEIRDRGESVSLEEAEKYIKEYLLAVGNHFSETFYKKRRMGYSNNDNIPMTLSSLMRPIVKDREGSVAIGTGSYYKAIWTQNSSRQKAIEATVLSRREKHKNDYDNVLGLVVFYNIIKDGLLTKGSIGEVLVQDPYKVFHKKIYHSIDAAYRNYVGGLDEVSIIPFKEAIEKRYKDMQGTDILKKVQEDLNKAGILL